VNPWNDFDQILYGGPWPPAPSILRCSNDNFGLKIRTQPRSKRTELISHSVDMEFGVNIEWFYLLRDFFSVWNFNVYLNPVSVDLVLSVYGSTVLLLDRGRFFSSLICTQSVGLLGRVICPSQGRYVHTEQHKHGINAHRHPCIEWDSNPRSSLSKERRQFMP
jgi:hypothetical protein